MKVLGGWVLCLAALVWWRSLGGGVSGPVPQPVVAGSTAGAASAPPGRLMPAAFSDPWALLSRAEAAGAADAESLPAEAQKAIAWLDPAKDAAWCARVASAQGAAVSASDELINELTLDLARQQVFDRWIGVLRQRGDGRSLAAADYLKAEASLGDASALNLRALNSQDGRVLALAAHLSCQPVQPGCQALVSRWLQLEAGNEQALSWQLELLPPESSERLAALTRLADALPDADSQRVWAALFASLPRSASAGLRQTAEQSALESLHWAGSGSMSPNWAMTCRQDQRPAAAACTKLAERIWQSERATLMDKVQAVLVGKKLGADELEWAQRHQTVKAVQAAGTRGHEEASAEFQGASPCAGVAARREWQQKLAREGEWRVYRQLAAQPVLRSPAAMPLIDK
ncbi:MAG: hypothetical protein IV107_08325 [Paucibacter sp.]|nr:hypothetical protein [Roseateles sp.]